MTNTVASENLAGREKEKVEKRRALGRGLESLLPGPRVVAPVPAPIVIQAVAEDGVSLTVFHSSPVQWRRKESEA